MTNASKHAVKKQYNTGTEKGYNAEKHNAKKYKLVHFT